MKYHRFIERSIMGALAFLKESLFADAYASRRGFLQARDPLAKASGTMLLLLAVLFSRSFVFICGIYGIVLVLVFASAIHPWFFIKRTWLFVPLFTLCIAIPAMFNMVTPGDPVISIRLFSASVTLTSQGIASAAFFFMRVLSSVSLVVLLTLTTRHFALLKVLRVFRVPQVLVMTVGMCYRYVYLFIDIILNTYSAIKSRVGFVTSSARAQRIVAWNVASLWQRSYRLQEQVYSAMISRGYGGEPQIMEELRLTHKDVLCIGVAAAVLLGSIWQSCFLS